MKLKKFALRGLIILAVAVALCMFFARTIQTITTPKIQLVTATSGRFEQKTEYQAQVTFPTTEKVYVPEAKKLPVTIQKIMVKIGTYVNEGDVVFTATIPSYEDDMKKLQSDYSAKSQELLSLDVENHGKSKDSRQNDLYDGMVAAQSASAEKNYQARLTAMENGIRLTGDISDWKSQLELQQSKVPADVTKAVDAAVAAKATFEDAENQYYAVLEDKKLKVKADVFEYIKKRRTILNEMDELSQQMVDLSALATSLTTIKAPFSGYVVSMDVAAGSSYDGSTQAYVLSSEGNMPELKIQLSENDREIEDGTKAELKSPFSYGYQETMQTTVNRTALGTDGQKYLYVNMPAEWLDTSTTAVRRLMNQGSVTVTITYRAKQSTTLLPPSAVREDGNSSYVWLVQRDWGGGFMSQSSMKVVKTAVTVLERSGKAVSIAEDLSYQQIADREDRGLSDGQKVMEYVQ